MAPSDSRPSWTRSLPSWTSWPTKSPQRNHTLTRRPTSGTTSPSPSGSSRMRAMRYVRCPIPCTSFFSIRNRFISGNEVVDRLDLQGLRGFRGLAAVVPVLAVFPAAVVRLCRTGGHQGRRPGAEDCRWCPADLDCTQCSSLCLRAVCTDYPFVAAETGRAARMGQCPAEFPSGAH